MLNGCVTCVRVEEGQEEEDGGPGGEEKYYMRDKME